MSFSLSQTLKSSSVSYGSLFLLVKSSFILRCQSTVSVTINCVGFCLCANWQCANNTVSKDRGEDYRAMASNQGMLCEGEKRERVGFDWWMVWMWVSWRVSSTVVNVSPSTRPSSLRDSHMCIIHCFIFYIFCKKIWFSLRMTATQLTLEIKGASNYKNAIKRVKERLESESVIVSGEKMGFVLHTYCFFCANSFS